MEFALLGPVAMCIIILGIAFARLYFVSVCLQDAVMEAARYGATGDGAASGQRLANITNMVKNLAGVPATLTMTPYQDWNGLASGTPASNTTYGTPGDPSQVVVYSATYTDPLTTSMVGMLAVLPGPARQAGTMTISMSTVIQNEPNFSTQ